MYVYIHIHIYMHIYTDIQVYIHIYISIYRCGAFCRTSLSVRAASFRREGRRGCWGSSLRSGRRTCPATAGMHKKKAHIYENKKKSSGRRTCPATAGMQKHTYTHTHIRTCPATAGMQKHTYTHTHTDLPCKNNGRLPRPVFADCLCVIYVYVCMYVYTHIYTHM